MQRNNTALFFVNSLHDGGAEKAVLNLCNALDKKNISSIVLTLYKDEYIKIPNYIDNWCLNLKRPNTSLKKIYQMQNLKKFLKDNPTWNTFIKKFQNTQFVLITAHLPMSHKVAMNSIFAEKCIYVMHLSMTIVPRYFRAIHNKILQNNYKNKKISCVSQGVAKELKVECRICANDITHIYNPIYLNKKKNYNNPHNRPYILMVGRLCKQKNQSMGIKIFNEIDNSNLDLLIVGDGPDKIKLEQLIKQYHLEKRAFIISYQENIYDWIANAKLLLSTSVFEGFSIVLVEALTLNTPAISSNCPFGPSEILTSELTDYLIPLSADKKIWKCKIDNILKNKYPKISEKYTEKFNPQTIIDQYINYYER